MTDIVLRDVDDVLLERIRRVAARAGWELPVALVNLIEQGLHVHEGEGTMHLEGGEADALQAALQALQAVPDDPGFAMIGRADGQAAGAPQG